MTFRTIPVAPSNATSPLIATPSSDWAAAQETMRWITNISSIENVLAESKLSTRGASLDDCILVTQKVLDCFEKTFTSSLTETDDEELKVCWRGIQKAKMTMESTLQSLQSIKDTPGSASTPC